MPQLKNLLISTFPAAVMLLFGEVNADPLTYEVVGDTVTITDCKETASGELVIPSTYEGKSVTSIGNGAFSSCSSLTSVTIPDSVTSIGNGTFGSCYSLTSVTIPDSVTSIGDNLFVACRSLKRVTIPDSVTSIGNGAFSGCSSLTSVTIPDSVTSIGGSAFSRCSGLTSVTIPDSVTIIEGNAFIRCSSLTSVTIPETVTIIRLGAFRGCSSLTNVRIPENVTSIGTEAFSGCSSLTSVTIAASAIYIGDNAFSYCSSLTNITFEGNAPRLHSRAFSDVASGVSESAKIFVNPGATGFGGTLAKLPVVIETKTTIYLDEKYSNGKDVNKTESTVVSLFTHFLQGEIFYTLDGTKPTFTSTPYTDPFQLTKSATIRAIAYSSDFTNSTEAEQVSLRLLPSYLMNVSTGGGGTAIIDPPDGPYLEGTEVTVTAKPEGNWDFIGWEGASTSSEATITITMDEAKALTPTFGTNVTVNEIGAGKVVQTPSNPVPYGSTVTFTAKPDTGHYLFRWAGEQKGNDNPTQLQVTKPNPAVSGLFAELTPLNFLKFKIEGETVAVVGCDKNASGELVIPSSYEGKPVTRIGSFAFTGLSLSNVTSVTIPDSVTSIGSGAFSDCRSLMSVTIGNSVTIIGVGAFSDCRSLTSVTIPDSVTIIGEGAFSDCRSLTSVTIGNSITSIGIDTFKSCKRLTSVTIPDSVTSIKNGAFSYCSRLTSVTIPESVTRIWGWAFQHCSALTSITFLGNAPNMRSGDVFSGVSNNAKIFINPGATGFGETVEGLPVVILKKLKISTFSKSASPFSLTFETKSDSTYKIEASHDLKKWGEIGEVQGTGSSVKFTDWREALFEKQYYRVKLVE